MDMDKDKIESALSSVITSMLSSRDEAAEKDHAELIEIFKSIIDPNRLAFIDMRLHFTLANCMRLAVKSKYEQNPEQLKFILMYHGFLESNIRYLMTTFEGMACCADKSRHVIRTLFAYFSTGQKFDYIKADDNFWMPYTLTFEDALSLFDALWNLHYGNPNKYLQFMAEYIPKAKEFVEDQIKIANGGN